MIKNNYDSYKAITLENQTAQEYYAHARNLKNKGENVLATWWEYSATMHTRKSEDIKLIQYTLDTMDKERHDSLLEESTAINSDFEDRWDNCPFDYDDIMDWDTIPVYNYGLW